MRSPFILLSITLAGCFQSPDTTDSGVADAANDVTEAATTQNIPIEWADACAPPPVSGDFPIAVGQVIQGKCQVCHQCPPKNHAPFPLLTYEDTLQPDPLAPYAGDPIWKVMHVVIQPDAVPHMPLSTAAQLSAQELQTLDGWLSTCPVPVAEGTGADVGEDAGVTD